MGYGARVNSPFLKVPESKWVASDTLAFAIRNQHPVSTGHSLMIPHWIVATWFDATREEQPGVFQEEGRRG
jgi:diadenosine tetraphosphate (Ap4A) HIT family hydrolase